MATRRSLGLRLAIAFPVSSLIGCAATPPPPAKTTPLPGVSFQIEERAHDGTFVLDPRSDRPLKVDANSRLVISFRVQPSDEVVQASGEWKRANGLLTIVLDMEKRRADLRAVEPDPKVPEAVDKHLKDLQSHADDLVKLLGDAQRLLSASAEFDPGFDLNAVLSGRFDGRPDLRKPYANLARWLRREIERLHAQAAALTAGRDKIEVTVEAFHDPVLGTRKAIHVENYDELPLGDLRPIDRLGLRLTPAEENRLRMELQQTEAAASLIREVQENGKKLKEHARRVLADLKQRFRSLEGLLRGRREGWTAAIDGAVAKLQGLALSPERKLIADSIVQDLQAYRRDIESLWSQIEKVTQIRQVLDGVDATTVEGILAGPQGFLQTIEELEAAVGGLVEWLPRGERLLKNVRDLAVGLTPEEALAIQPQQVKDFLDTLAKDFPATIRFIQMAVESFGGDSQAIVAAETLGATDAQPIPRTLDNLPDGAVELDHAGLTIGDRVSIRIRFRQKGTQPGEPGPVIDETTLRVTTVLTGLHRQIGVNLIFARAATGSEDAKEWKPNVAAVADLHFRIRKDDNRWKRFFNILDPGLGVHMASLDQGEDSIEFGMGVTASLLGGFLTAGYGWNLSVDDDADYYYVGIDLLDVLNTGKGKVLPGS